MKSEHDHYMDQAVALSLETVKSRTGGPFGAVVVRNGEIVGRGINRVTATLDPTAHAEVVAIRDACRQLGTHNLAGCDLYTSCEPCPMCLSAIYWAHLATVYYANTKSDAARIGFDDFFIYQELEKEPEQRTIKMLRLNNKDAINAFSIWSKDSEKVEY